MPRPVTTLQVLCDHCRDCIMDSEALAGAATWPSNAMMAVHSTLWSLVRQVCEVVGYDPGAIPVGRVMNGRLALADDVELPREFIEALDAAVASIASPATQRICGSKIFWACRIVQVAVAVTINYNAVAATAMVARQRGRKRQDDPNHVEPSPELPKALPVPSPRFAEDQPEPRAVQVVQPVLDQLARYAPVHDSEAASEQRSGPMPVVIAGKLSDTDGTTAPPSARPDSILRTPGVVGTEPAVKAPTRVNSARSDGRSKTESKESSASDATRPGTTNGEAAERTSRYLGKEPVEPLANAEEASADVNGASAAAPIHRQEEMIAEASAVPPRRSAFFDTFGGTAPRAAYGTTFAKEDQQPAASGAFAADLIGRLSQVPQERDPHPVLTLSVEERGYASPLMTLQQLRSLTHETLGPIASERNRGEEVSVERSFVSVDRVDGSELFRRLFPDLEDESFARLYMDEPDQIDDDTSVKALDALATSSTSPIELLRPSDEIAFESSRMDALIGPQAGSKVKLHKDARRAAATLGAKREQDPDVVKALQLSFKIDIRSTVVGIMGPAGVGKTRLISEIKDNIRNMWSGYSRPDVIHLDCSSTNFENDLNAAISRKNGLRRTVLLDECTFMTMKSAATLDAFDQVIFLGDPRQLGSSNAAQWIREYIEVAGGSHVFLDKVYRNIRPHFFNSLNFVSYDGKFELFNSSDTADPAIKIASCGGHPFCIAATMLEMAVYSAADRELTYIATQDRLVLEYIRGLLRLNAATYRKVKDKIKIVPISGIQGLELDTLVINPREIDSHAVDIGSTLKLVFVVLGRIKRSLALVQPVDSPQTDAPLFSFLLHSMIVGRSA